MKKIHIKNKLEDLGFSLDDFCMGNFDIIGESCAKKQRDSNSEYYKKFGAFFRPNYERGLLIYALILEYDIKSFLEIGFGRGYGTMCAAMAMQENGGGTITTVDPDFNQAHLGRLKQTFPKDWFDMIDFVSGISQTYLVDNDDTFDFIYIDGDHRYDAVKRDWDLCENRYNKVLLFDDYHMPSKAGEDGMIECAKVIDDIEDDSKELIIMDRRIFIDDLKRPDDAIDYGQVLLTND